MDLTYTGDGWYAISVNNDMVKYYPGPHGATSDERRMTIVKEVDGTFWIYDDPNGDILDEPYAQWVLSGKRKPLMGPFPTLEAAKVAYMIGVATEIYNVQR